MATKNASLIKQPQEIVPSLDLPDFEKALATMDQMDAYLEPIAKEAKELKIVDRATRERAGILTAQLKNTDGSSEDTMAPYDKVWQRVRDFIKTRKLRIQNRVTEI